ncbi:MAG: hypothetical protein B0D85_01280 [Candidatus Sedimenticola endophacoides]|nr:MAG: hypothetical protein B0D85_01280 [Candidatus Sedimenticola endophacoides]
MLVVDDEVPARARLIRLLESLGPPYEVVGEAANGIEALACCRRLEVELLLEQDLLPFRRLIDNGLEAIMPAHVVYERAAPELAGFSRFWLAEVLRGQLGFQGVIFSDDLSMNAAHEAGSYGERAALALEAGCDMILVCNDPQGAAEVLQSLEAYSDPVSQMRLIRMHGRRSYRRDQLHLEPKWAEALALVAEFEGNPSLDLNFS